MKKIKIKLSVLFLVLLFGTTLAVSASDSDQGFRKVEYPQTFKTKNFTVKVDQERTLTLCNNCKWNQAKATCNKEGFHAQTLSHGSCFYNVFESTVRIYCSKCGKTENGVMRHRCYQSHTGCGAGRVNLCGF